MSRILSWVKRCSTYAQEAEGFGSINSVVPKVFSASTEENFLDMQCEPTRGNQTLPDWKSSGGLHEHLQQ